MKTKITSKYGTALKLYIFKSSKEASDVLKNNHIHFALVDLNLMNESGLEVIKKIKDLNHGTRVISFSTNTSMVTCMEFFQIGADYHLKKPIDMNNLYNIIDHCFQVMDYWKQVVLLK